MAYEKEQDPCETMKDLLEDNWIPYVECPAPIVLIANDANDASSRYDLNMGDHIIIKTAGAEVIKRRGSLVYYDKAYPILLEVLTAKSRQRLRDIYKQIKAICFAKRFEFTGYQLVYPDSYTEMVNEQLNIWKSEVRIKIEAAGVCIDTIT
jgi:hypothetical protein